MVNNLSRQNNQVNLTIQEKINLYDLEKKLVDTFGKAILNYSFVFTEPKIRTITTPEMNAPKIHLINEYIQNANELLKKIFNTEKKCIQGNEFDSLMETLQEVYLARYLQAKALYADYELIRVPTWTEVKLWEAGDRTTELPDYTYRINIPDAFVIDEYGNFNINKTIRKEAKDHTIKKYLCAIPEANFRKNDMFNLLFDRTTRAMALNINEKEITEICGSLIQEVLLFLLQKIFNYIDKGYTPHQAWENIHSLLKQTLISKNWQTSSDFQSLITKLRTLASEDLLKIEELNPETVDILTNEMMETIGYMIDFGRVMPTNILKLVFRNPEKNNQYEKDLHAILESYIIMDNGSITKFPMESYDIDLSVESKTMIFEHVTGNLVNPEFTLEDYIFIHTYGT